METIPLKTHTLKPRFDLLKTILSSLKKNKKMLRERDVLVLSSKIVALAEGCLVDLKTIIPSKRAHSPSKYNFGTSGDPRVIELILREADAIFFGKFATTIKNKNIVPAAGVDLSNVPDGFAITWPKNPEQTAKNLRQHLQKKLRIKKLGVVIGDSTCKPLRWGTTGVALSWAGFEGVEDARGQQDIHGRKLRLTRKAVADNLVISAQLVMGEGAERVPFVIIRSAPVKFTNRRQNPKTAFAQPRDCILNGLYNKAVFEINF